MKFYLYPFLFITFLLKLVIVSVYGSSWVWNKFFRKKSKSTSIQDSEKELISRKAFLRNVSLATSTLPFGGIAYAVISGSTDFQIHRQRIIIPNLPKAFHGLRLLQFSDFHAGSFLSRKPVQQGLELIQKEKPDIICFTGDLINYKAKEVKEYFPFLDKLHAPLGIYANLGNHDYGLYHHWKTWNQQEKERRVNAVAAVFEELNWKLLKNETVILTESQEKLALVGIENWSVMDTFPTYGNLKLALQGSEEASSKILLSHDPSHWKAEVLKQYPQIDLMLAGHTHGSQFGIEWGDFKWSPIQYVYEHWAGLYQHEQQYLYVNRGFGHSELFPGRIGILPEITVLELVRV